MDFLRQYNSREILSGKARKWEWPLVLMLVAVRVVLAVAGKKNHTAESDSFSFYAAGDIFSQGQALYNNSATG